MFYWFFRERERQGGGEREREKTKHIDVRNIDQLPPVRALAGDQTHNLLGVGDNIPTEPPNQGCCFHFLPVINNAAMNIHVRVFLWTPFWILLGIYLVVELLGHTVTPH